MLRCYSLLLFCAFLFASGCSKNKPPFSPEDERKTFRLPPGFRAELVAAEPEISDVITISFDPSGRLYAAEMPEYPLNPEPLGRIKLLEDRDNDGRYEHATVFAEKLHFPEGVMPWKKGVLVACAPDLLYLEDTNGDGRADIRKVVMNGFSTGNPQLRLNNPLYGIDNWIYAAHPRPPVPRRFVKEFGNTTTDIRFPDRPDIPALSVRGMDIRFHPDRFQVERVSGNSQFGHGFDAWGNRFTVWNNDHVRHVVIRNEDLTHNPYLAIPTAMQSASDHESQAAVYPVTQNPLVIHDTQAGRFTSACGLSVYAGGNLPTDFENNSFTCEPVHNLVHRDILKPQGATFTAKRAYEQKEFMAATDAWFRPVFTTTGPDGALYVVDYYRFTVEHPEFVPPQLLKQINFESQGRYGRIWRILHESSKPARKPDLASADSARLTAELANPNLWWRINAQRLLVERQDKSVVPQLEKIARESSSPYGRLHALWTLDGLGALSNPLTLEALSFPQAQLRGAAVRLAESRLSDPKIKARLLAMAEDADAQVQFHVASALTRLPASETMQSLEKIARAHTDDAWFQAAVLASASDDAIAWFRFSRNLPEPGRQQFARRAASIVGARKKDAETAALLRDLAAMRAPADQDTVVAALDGLADGVNQGAADRVNLPAAQPVLLGILSSAPAPVVRAALRTASVLEMKPTPQLQALVRQASATAQDASAPVERRASSAGIVGLAPTEGSAKLLSGLLSPSQPEEVQTAAAAALDRLPSDQFTRISLDNWRGATSKVRDALLTGFFEDPKRVRSLLEAVKGGTVQAWALGPARTRQLMQYTDPAIREEAKAILTDVEPNRKATYDKYLPAITKSADAGAGQKVFARACSDCHKVGNVGHELGPDLRSVTKRYKETLLADILMPNQNIEGGYEEYLVTTTDGREITGILAKETATTLTLRRRKGDEDTILRSNVKEMRSLSVSPMPEDLEKDITVSEMADLIAYIKSLR